MASLYFAQLILINNFPPLSDIILQILNALLTLITSLIVAYFAFKLGQQKKPKSYTKLEIIKAATNEVKKYSQQNISVGENIDLLDYIIYKIPIRVNELAAVKSNWQTGINSIDNRFKLNIALLVCVLSLQILFYLIFDLQPIYSLVAKSIIFFLLFLVIALEVFIQVPSLKNVRSYGKKARSLIEELRKIEGTKTINSISRDKLTEFIRQRKKLDFGTSLNDIKAELEMYGIKVLDSDVIRSHFNCYLENPKDRCDLISVYYLDQKTHESFDELSDEEILNFLETATRNLESIKSQRNS